MTGTYRYLVTVQIPGPVASDGDSSFTETWVDADPATWSVSLDPISADHAIAGTVLATATHQVRGRYHADVTPRARLVFEGRVLNVVSVRHLEERRRTLELVCAEVA